MEEECALDKNASMTTYKPNKQEKYDLTLTLQGKKNVIIKKLTKELQKRRGVKWFLCTKTNMVRSNHDDEDQVATPYF